MDATTREVTLIVIISIFLLIVAIGIIILVLVYQKRQLKYLQEKQQLQHHFHQELLHTQLEIQEQTFKHISQEIHDNIGQILSLARLHVNTMNPEDAGDVTEKIQDADQLIGKAIQDLRDLSKSLNTAFIADVGLLRAIEYELKLIKKITAYSVSFHIEGQPFSLSPQQELILFRIFQEVLNNIIKHAKASEVSLHACYDATNFVLRMKDNGQGFDMRSDAPTNQAATGMGIRNMKSRAQLIHAAIAIQSAVTQGTAVTVTVPLQT